jgi:DNA replication factor GINS
MNRSYHLFSGKQEFDLVDSMPLNLTPEEETFYFSIIETLKNHRLTLSGQEIIKTSSDVIEDDVEDIDEDTPSEPKSNSLSDIADVAMGDSKDDALEKIDEALESEEESDKSLKSGDEVLDKLDEISKSKVITDEVREPIEKQISKSVNNASDAKKNLSKTPNEFDDIEILDDESQFIDLDMTKRTRESEIVTILVLDEIDSIVGIDEKVYGPFRPQDIVLLPKINANIFVKNRKARFVKI